MPSREEDFKHNMNMGRSARVSRIVTLVVAAYFLTCFLFSFRMNPAGHFFSTLETTPLSALFQGILFAVSLIFVFLFAHIFKEASARLILLISIQAYLAISAFRCGEPSFVVGALIVGIAVLYHGYADVHGLCSSRSPSGTPNHKSLDAVDEKNLNGSDKKMSNPRSTSAADTSNENPKDNVISRTNRKLFIVLCVFSAIIPLGFVTQLLFFRSSGDAPKEHVFFGTSAGWLWIAAFGAAVMGAFLYISFKEGVGRKLSLERSPRLNVVLFLLALIPAAMLMIIMVARISGFLAPTYDMGIFTQMFHSIKTTGAPITTLERDMPLSHFNIHMSPIFYVLLPFYAIVPSAETLQVLQILVVLSGVIPLDLLAKRYFRGSKAWRLAAAVLYVLQPGLLGSNLYDLHENCFLAPLTLWLIYACHTRRTLLVALFTALTLMVKEDAALYVVAIALFVFFGGISADNQYQRRKDYIHGAILFAGALIYFGWVSTYLNNAGYGIMTYRFNNLMIYKELGVLGIIPAILQNPAYFLSTFWTMEKIGYLLVVLGSLGFLPLFQRKGAHYFLIIPLVVMNLSSNYIYQYDLRFQYHYGSVALLAFMAMMAVSGYTERVLAVRLVPEKIPEAVLPIRGATGQALEIEIKLPSNNRERVSSAFPVTDEKRKMAPPRQGSVDQTPEAEAKSSLDDREWVPVTHPTLKKMSGAMLLSQDMTDQAPKVKSIDSSGDREHSPAKLPALKKTSRTALLRQGMSDNESASETNRSSDVEDVTTSGVLPDRRRGKNGINARPSERTDIRSAQRGTTLRPGLRMPTFASQAYLQQQLASSSNTDDERSERPLSRQTSKTDGRTDTQPIRGTETKQRVQLARIEKGSRTSRANHMQDENRVLAAGGFVRPQEVEDEPSPNKGSVNVRQHRAMKASPSVESKKPRSVRLRRVLAFVVAFALFCAASQSLLLLSERWSTILYEKENRQNLNAIRHSLDQIPKEASVGATTFFTCYLANRAEIYDLGYHKRSLKDGHLEYLVFDQRWDRFSCEEMMEKALGYGYVRMSGTPENVVVLKWAGARTP